MNVITQDFLFVCFSGRNESAAQQAAGPGEEGGPAVRSRGVSPLGQQLRLGRLQQQRGWLLSAAPGPQQHTR